jgi:hypothetical protein
MVSPSKISPTKREVIQLPISSKIFLSGIAGSGKTTVGIERLLYLMSEGVPGNSILVLVPQRMLGTPYQEALSSPGVVAGGMPSVVTLSGIARRMVELFWPMISEMAGFANPSDPPVFLNLETAQYYMAYLVRPLLEKGFFSSLTIDRNRLYSQIIDNLNKAAIVDFSYQEISSRLNAAWSGEPGQARVYDDAQTCAAMFREYCLEHNLLDFSLQIEIFRHYLWNNQLCRDYLFDSFHHLIVDNVEEDVPLTHDLLSEWIPAAESCIVIYDNQAGYRRFLGADPAGAYRLSAYCDQTRTWTESYVTSPAIQALSTRLDAALNHKLSSDTEIDPRPALTHKTHTYYPQMLDWLADQVELLLNEEDILPSDIVILAPFLSDSLRYSIVYRLENKRIPVKTYRPSRSLREEPATSCVLTLASLAHPGWGFLLANFDVAQCLMQAVEGLDLIRAKILTDSTFRMVAGIPSLLPFDQVNTSTQQRVSYFLGEKYEKLRLWLEEYRQSGPGELDHFISRLFGEVLSQPGFGFHISFDGGQVTANLVDSIRKFRKVTGETLTKAGVDVGQEYIRMLSDGVIAAQYLPVWQIQSEQAVFVAPAYTYLISNYPVDVQFWLDIGNHSWAERLYQPLTHPYVLSRNWPSDKVWTDTEEVETGSQVLSAMVQGLLNRCRKKIYLGLSEYNEQGYEQRGPLLQAFNRILQSLNSEAE